MVSLNKSPSLVSHSECIYIHSSCQLLSAASHHFVPSLLCIASLIFNKNISAIMIKTESFLCSALTRRRGCRGRPSRCNTPRCPWCSWWGQSLRSSQSSHSPLAHFGQLGHGGCNFEIPNSPFPINKETRLIFRANSFKVIEIQTVALWNKANNVSNTCTVSMIHLLHVLQQLTLTKHMWEKFSQFTNDKNRWGISKR